MPQRRLDWSGPDEVAAVVRAFRQAVDGYAAHARALGSSFSNLDPTQEQSSRNNGHYGIYQLPVLRVRMARASLFVINRALAEDSFANGLAGDEIREIRRRFELTLFDEPAEVVLELVEAADRHDVMFVQSRSRGLPPPVSGYFVARATKYTDSTFINRVNFPAATRAGLYKTSQLLMAALYRVDLQDFRAFAESVNEDSLRSSQTLETPFPSSFITYTHPQPLPSRAYAQSTHAEQLGVYLTDDVTATSIEQLSMRPNLVTLFGIDLPNSLAAPVLAQYLLRGAARVENVNGKFCCADADGSWVTPGTTNEVRLIKPGSWKSRTRQRPVGRPEVPPTEGTTTGEHSSRDAHDRRGTYVKYYLDPAQLYAFGLPPVQGANHFWVGWRNDTRVNDPVYRTTHERPLTPDSVFRVRSAVPNRPDLPEKFDLFDVFAEIKNENDSVTFEPIGTHPRAVEMWTARGTLEH